METTDALRWDMHHRGMTVAFSALRLDDRYELSITRGDDVLVKTHAPDATALFQQSRALRERLSAIGFAAKPEGQRTSHLVAGPCWGPAAPIQSSILEALVCR